MSKRVTKRWGRRNIATTIVIAVLIAVVTVPILSFVGEVIFILSTYLWDTRPRKRDGLTAAGVVGRHDAAERHAA